MSILARRLAEPLEAAELDARPWLPEEAPLPMPRQAFDAESPAIGEILPTSPPGIGKRRLALFLGTLLFAALVSVVLTAV